MLRQQPQLPPQACTAKAEGLPPQLRAKARKAKGLPQQLQATTVTSHHRIKRCSPNFAYIAKIPKSARCATDRATCARR